MRVEIRNLFRLIRMGAFNDGAPILLEPMSEFKWQRMADIAIYNNVSNIVIPTLLDAQNHPDFNFTESLKNEWLQRAQQNADREEKAATIANDDEVKITNFYLNHRLKKLIDKERHTIDTSINSIYLLQLYISLTSAILSQNFKLSQLVRVGKFLREEGDKVDYIKFEKWIKELHIRKMVDLESSMLIQLLEFSVDEFPFLHSQIDTATKLALTNISAVSKYDIMYYNERANNSDRTTLALLKNNRRYMKYYPAEATSKVIQKIFTSISQIEE